MELFTRRAEAALVLAEIEQRYLLDSIAYLIKLLIREPEKLPFAEKRRLLNRSPIGNWLTTSVNRLLASEYRLRPAREADDLMRPRDVQSFRELLAACYQDYLLGYAALEVHREFDDPELPIRLSYVDPTNLTITVTPAGQLQIQVIRGDKIVTVLPSKLILIPFETAPSRMGFGWVERHALDLLLLFLVYWRLCYDLSPLSTPDILLMAPPEASREEAGLLREAQLTAYGNFLHFIPSSKPEQYQLIRLEKTLLIDPKQTLPTLEKRVQRAIGADPEDETLQQSFLEQLTDKVNRLIARFEGKARLEFTLPVSIRMLARLVRERILRPEEAREVL